MTWTRQFATFALVVTLIPACAAVQKGRWVTADDAVVRDMIAKEKKWASGNCRAEPGLAEIFADEFQGTATDGKRYGKAEAAKFEAGKADRDCKFGEVKFQFFGDTVAVAYGTESSIRKSKDGKEYVRCLAWTDTWLKRGGKWLIIAAQDNVVDCPK